MKSKWTLIDCMARAQLLLTATGDIPSEAS